MSATTTAAATRAEICAVACAEAFRGDGEIFCSPMGTTPRAGALLAKATFEPDLLISDGEATTIDGIPAMGSGFGGHVVEGYIPFRTVFDVVAHGNRHVMMGASQIDRYGNQNISAIGDHAAPKIQLLGARGGPGNTANHATSYWVANHSTRIFVEQVDFVSGVGTDRAAKAGTALAGFHDLRRVITNLAVLDFETLDGAMRLRSVHPGVTVEDVVAATGFALTIADEVPETRLPTDLELRLLREVIDPKSFTGREVKA